MNKALVIAGTILADVIKTIPTYPDAGKLVQISSITRAVGGAVPNTAIDIATLDPSFPVRVFGRVGNDEYGTYVTSRMKQAGIDTSAVIVSKTAPTSFTDVMSVEGGERTFFTLAGANDELDIEDFDFDRLAPLHLHLGYLLLLGALDKPDAEYGSRAARLLASAVSRGIPTSIDLISEPGDRYSRVVVPALPYVDYLIINEIEAAHLSGTALPDTGPDAETLRTLAERLLALGVRKKVILHCPTLGVCLDKNRRFTAVPSLSLPAGYIAGTTGAGDAFCAASLYALLHGLDDRDVLSLASCAAAANLSAADSVSGMRPLAEVRRLETLYKRR